MITRMPRSCVVHRAALLDFVDGQPRTAASAAALSHLERCGACEEELAGIVRTLAALRRLGQTTLLVEPPGHAWPTLKARITARRADRWMPRFSVAGLALSAALAVMISLPATISPGGADWSYTEHRTGRQEEARPVRSAVQRSSGRQAVTPLGGVAAATPAPGRHFDRRVYAEAAWTPEAGAPKPRPR
jgi:anti-sigma factor RsiW